jgi:hypothetical protein
MRNDHRFLAVAVGVAVASGAAVPAAPTAVADFDHLESDQVMLGDFVGEPYEPTRVWLTATMNWARGTGGDAGKTRGRLKGDLGYVPSMGNDPGCARVVVEWLRDNESVIGTSWRRKCVTGVSLGGEYLHMDDNPANWANTQLSCARVKLSISKDPTDPTENDYRQVDSKKVCAGGK